MSLGLCALEVSAVLLAFLLSKYLLSAFSPLMSF